MVYFIALRPNLVYFEFAAFREQKYMAYDSFRIDSPYGKILSRKEPINQNARIYLRTILPYDNKQLFHERVLDMRR